MSRLPAESGSDSTPESWASLRARTPARILTGRAGAGYRTPMQLDLREGHAFAIDAVRAEMDLNRDFGPEFVARWGLFEVATLARSKAEHLAQPGLGRRLHEQARDELMRACSPGADLQVVIADGLSAEAVARQVPTLLPLLAEEAGVRSWSFGRPFAICYGRVGVLNDIGEALDPTVVVLLIGERPGLATADSLSAYLAYRPRSGHNDARRNLISNIHSRGVSPEAAAPRIAALADRLRHLQASGLAVKESL